MPDRLTDDVAYLYERHACPACTALVAHITDLTPPEDGRWATTVDFRCECGYRLRWVCRAPCCADLPGAPEAEPT